MHIVEQPHKDKIDLENILLEFSQIYKPLIIIEFISARQTSILWKPARLQACAVSRGELSPKLSTGIVDR